MNARLLLPAALLLACLALRTGVGQPPMPPLEPDAPYRARRANPVTYRVDFSVVVTPPYRTKTLKVWLPLPPSDFAQQVSESELSTFPMKVAPQIGSEKVYGNRFACFTFDRPQGAQIVRHRFTIKTWELTWDVEPRRVVKVARWPERFAPYLRGERLLPVDERLGKLAAAIVPQRHGPTEDLGAVLEWVSAHLRYDHADCSLQASALHALEKRAGHCSDYHGLCAALGRNLGYPTRVAYGINPYPKNSPSHCKLEVYLPPYGWVPFDVSETQQLMKRIAEESRLDAARKERLTKAARDRLFRGFRDNTWLLQTRGTDYDLAPPASRRVAVVRTAHVEADGVALPEPDPANPKQREFAWMTVHHYAPDREVISPFKDWRSLEKEP